MFDICNRFFYSDDMEKDKRPILSFRADEEIRQIIEDLAKEEYRSMSRQLEKIVLEWLKEKGMLKKK